MPAAFSLVTATQPNRIDVVIIGGGAAGFFAAIHCAESAPTRRVVILEKGARVLTKVLVSGGGRCNVTHACFDPSELIKRYPRGMRELRGPFHSWQPRDTVAWFGVRGVAVKTEPDGRMFPTTDRSDTIADCLTRAAREAGVQVMTRRGVIELTKTGDEFLIRCDSGESWIAGRVMLATGGMRPGPISDALAEFGHRIESPVPSLFTFHVEDERIKGLQGLSVANVGVGVEGSKLKESGPLLVTHWGFSGPAILKLSAWGARELAAADYRFSCRVNWIHPRAAKDAEDSLRKMKETDGRKRIAGTPLFDLPKRIWERLVAAAEISDAQNWSQLSAQKITALGAQLADGKFPVTGKSMNKEEFVTCGGVSLKEVDFKTMESRNVKGLHFGGEVLDIDAITGGFNFQAAWTTGRLAGLAMAGS